MAIRFPSVSASILDAVGDTPLVEVEGILAKLEFLNPSGSIKARIAKYMIEMAEGEKYLQEYFVQADSAPEEPTPFI